MRAWSGRRAGFPPRAGRFAPRPALLRTPRPHSRRGPCPCAGPLRRGAPAAASRGRSGGIRPRPLWGLAGPAPRASPPALPLGLVRRYAAPAALAGPVWPGASPRFAAGSPRKGGVALASSRGRPCPARGPAGSPPARPLRGFGGGWLLPRGARAAFGPRFFAPRPRGFFPRPRPRGLRAEAPAVSASALFNRCPWSLGSPPSPLPSPAPAGGRGRRGADLRRVASFSAARFSRVSFARFGPFSRSPSRC